MKTTHSTSVNYSFTKSKSISVSEKVIINTAVA